MKAKLQTEKAANCNMLHIAFGSGVLEVPQLFVLCLVRGGWGCLLLKLWLIIQKYKKY